MKVLIEDHNGRRYVYLYTSKRASGDPRPKVMKRYMGILDEPSGMVIQKKVRPEELLSIVHDRELECVTRGSVLLADSVARSYGIRDSILSRFPEYGDVLYGMALVVALEPHRIMSLGDCFAGYCMEGIVERDRTRAAVVREAVGYLQKNAWAKIELDATPDKLYIFMFTGPSLILKNQSGIHALSEQGSYIQNNSVFFVTDDSGLLLMVRSKDNSSEIVDTISTAMGYAKRRCESPVLVLDRGMPLETLARVAFKGFEFIYDATSVESELGFMQSEAESPTDHWRAVKIGTSEYRINEVPLELRDVCGKLGFVRGSGKSDRLRAVMWYDPKELDQRMDVLRSMTRFRTAQLSSLPLDDAREFLKDNIESQFMSAEPEEDGGTRVRVRTKKRRVMALMSCVRTFITNASTLEECIWCIDIQSYLRIQSEPLAYAMSDNRGKYRHGSTSLAVEAIKIRACTENAARAAGLEGTDVDLLYSEAARYGVVRNNGFLRRSSVPARTARLLERMGVDASHDLEGSDRLVRRRDGRARRPHPFL